MKKNSQVWEAIDSLNKKEKKGGFILDYIMFKMYNYNEPERKGTPRGDKIGFSAQKYHAAILVGVTNWKLKEIAKQVNVSYGLLRKWKTESDFQSEVERHRPAFVREMIKRIKGPLELQHEKTIEYFKGNGLNPLKKDLESPLDPAERVMIDAHNYNEEILKCLLDAGKSIIREMEDKGGDEYWRGWGLYSSIVNVISYSKYKEFTFNHPLITKHLATLVKDMISNKRTLSEEEQRIAVHFLSIVERELGTIYDALKK